MAWIGQMIEMCYVPKAGLETYRLDGKSLNLDHGGEWPGIEECLLQSIDDQETVVDGAQSRRYTEDKLT